MFSLSTRFLIDSYPNITLYPEITLKKSTLADQKSLFDFSVASVRVVSNEAENKLRSLAKEEFIKFFPSELVDELQNHFWSHIRYCNSIYDSIIDKMLNFRNLSISLNLGGLALLFAAWMAYSNIPKEYKKTRWLCKAVGVAGCASIVLASASSHIITSEVIKALGKHR